MYSLRVFCVSVCTYTYVLCAMCVFACACKHTCGCVGRLCECIHVYLHMYVVSGIGRSKCFYISNGPTRSTLAIAYLMCLYCTNMYVCLHCVHSNIMMQPHNNIYFKYGSC